MSISLKNESFPYWMENGAKRENLGGLLPSRTQGEPHLIVTMGTYWMGRSSVKVARLIPLSIA